MHRIVISNSTCLIGLERIGKLDILEKLYGEIIISEAVQKEVNLSPTPWIKVEKVNNREALRFLMFEIDEGEAETIILGTERPGAVLILDEKKARKIARRLNLTITGLMAVLLKAKEKKIISSIKKTIEELEAANFRLSEEIKRKVLKLGKEK
jgi:uncharacterized protein